MYWPCVCLSVSLCPMERLQPRRAAGLLLSAVLEISSPQHGPAANASSVAYTADVGRCTHSCYILLLSFSYSDWLRFVNLC